MLYYIISWICSFYLKELFTMYQIYRNNYRQLNYIYILYVYIYILYIYNVQLNCPWHIVDLNGAIFDPKMMWNQCRENRSSPCGKVVLVWFLGGLTCCLHWGSNPSSSELAWCMMDSRSGPWGGTTSHDPMVKKSDSILRRWNCQMSRARNAAEWSKTSWPLSHQSSHIGGRDCHTSANCKWVYYTCQNVVPTSSGWYRAGEKNRHIVTFLVTSTISSTAWENRLLKGCTSENGDNSLKMGDWLDSRQPQAAKLQDAATYHKPP